MIDPLQAFFAGLKNQRASSGLTIDKFLKQLSAFDKEARVNGISAVGDSYRGYYEDFAFEPGNTSVEELTAYIHDEVLNEVFTGYKGGSFLMTKDTPLHVANYGSCGKQIVGMYEKDGSIELVLSDDDEI